MAATRIPINRDRSAGDAARPFHFGTKAGTLAHLAAHVTRATLCDQIIVPAGDWPRRRDGIIADIRDRFGDSPLAVRSSAAAEDGIDNSLAGAHLSRTDVEPTPEAIARAIDAVLASYAPVAAGDQVLVQPMVADTVISGVVLTRDLDTGSPYYVVSYDDFSGRTDTVTGGAESKTILVHRSRIDALRSPRFKKLIDSVVELERITGSHELDIEFCITNAGDVYILQARPLAARRHWQSPPDDAVDRTLDRIRAELGRHMAAAPGLAGRTTILGEMPDWNPAEMIGITPRPLALSLYRRLITDGVWAEARARMGYRRVSEPLLVDFCGRPYIDVRLSFNSFLPADVGDALAGRLVDHQIEYLRERPELHDKVEFEIAVTCRDFSFAEKRQRLQAAGFAAADLDVFEGALQRLTHAALKTGRDGIERLVAETDRLLADRLDDSRLPLAKRLGALLNDCTALGTLPFSQLARHGFIGVQFLRSLVERGVFSSEDAERFMQGIQTVAADLVADMHAVATGALDQAAFLGRYGHLRPTTYDILSWRYDERPDLYLGHVGREPPAKVGSFVPTARQRTAIDGLLRASGYALSADELLSYISAAVKAREQAKFAFTRSISDALALLCRAGEESGLSRDELSFVPIETFLEGGDLAGLRPVIKRRREEYKMTRAIRLPHLIGEPADIDVVRMPLGQPTFITGRKVAAKTVRLGAGEVPEVNGRIVLIESADPGFDWIFSHRIEGLVTKYGGSNSHMAIRCAEFGLPAAIGCGERLFDALAKGSVVELDCASRKVSAH